MPTIAISYSDLCQLLGKDFPLEDLESALSSVKCELKAKEDDEVTVELNSDRPDMLSVEGVARTLQGFLGVKTGFPQLESRKGPVKVTVLPSSAKLRPFISCSVLRGIKLSDEIVKQMMQLQEKLHETYCRNRRKASIGMYDLDKVSANIVYEAVPPDEISFVPLEETEKMNGREILEKTEKGRKYAHIISSFQAFPLLRDEKGVVLSMPPILNSEYTKVTPQTQNLFMDVTGLDEKLVNSVNNILIYNLGFRGGNPETVQIKYPSGRKVATPILKPSEGNLDLNYVNAVLGLSLRKNNVIDLLERARFHAEPKTGKNIRVLIPSYRCDILHQIDLVEDVAISYGYSKMEPELPATSTVGNELPISTLTRVSRDLMIGFTFQEVLNYILSNRDILCLKMYDEREHLIEIANPMSTEYSVARDFLLPGLLSYLNFNRHIQYPQKIFECGDVIVYDSDAETYAKTLRKLAGTICNYRVSYEDVQSIVYNILRTLNVNHWNIEDLKHPSFIQGRAAVIRIGGVEVAILGEIYPAVLKNFELENPVAAFEMNLSEILSIQKTGDTSRKT
jgi:phenylalanyl-tRNA synthetase beta chain